MTGFYKNRLGNIYAVYENLPPPRNADYRENLGNSAHRLMKAHGMIHPEGRSKKDAEQNAAILCLKNII